MSIDGGGKNPETVNLPEFWPIYNGPDEKLNLGYRMGTETAPSKIWGTDIQRPYGLRLERGRMWRQFRREIYADNEAKDVGKLTHLGRKVGHLINHLRENKDIETDWRELAEKFKRYDKLNWQLMEQRQEVEVEVDGCGIQKATSAELYSPDPNKSQGETRVIWTGISNEPDGIGWLGIKMAEMENCRVIAMGYPCSWEGDVTEEFIEAVKTKGLEPHTEFFIKATKQITEKLGIEKFRLVGYSTGGALAGNALKDGEFADSVVDATFIAPGGCCRLNEKAVLAMEMVLNTLNVFGLPQLSPGNLKTVPFDAGRRERTLAANRALVPQILSRTEWWKGLKNCNVPMTAVVYRSDWMTRAIKVTDEFEQEGMEVVKLRGSHASPLMYPGKTINRLKKDQFEN